MLLDVYEAGLVHPVPVFARGVGPHGSSEPARGLAQKDAPLFQTGTFESVVGASEWQAVVLEL